MKKKNQYWKNDIEIYLSYRANLNKKKGVAKIIAHIIFDISNIKTYSLFNCVHCICRTYGKIHRLVQIMHVHVINTSPQCIFNA